MYPSVEAGFGTNAIHWITSVPAIGTVLWDRRSFADRHGGTNVLFFDGSVRLHHTPDLDRMIPNTPDTIWDVW